jgi:hypothetical protein
MLAEALERMRHVRLVLNSRALDEPLSDDDKMKVGFLFYSWQLVARDAAFENCLTTTVHAIGVVQKGLRHSGVETAIRIPDMTARQALIRVEQLDENYRRDVGKRFVWLLDEDRSTYFSGLQAKSLAAAFPSAIPEMEEADRCYALSRDTASVFHMMRSVEHVLRALVVSVGVTNPKVPLDYQDWQNLIDQLESHAKAGTAGWSRPQSLHAREFFSRVVADLHSFKDNVRNILMHTRSGGTYDAPGALSVRNRVEGFFGFVSARTDESVTALLDEKLFLNPS